MLGRSTVLVLGQVLPSRKIEEKWMIDVVDICMVYD